MPTTFEIVDAETREPIGVSFSNPSQAAGFVKTHNATPGAARVRMEKVFERDWRDDEADRERTYAPWHADRPSWYPDHHYAAVEGRMVTFFTSVRHGQENYRTTYSLRTYLDSFAGGAGETAKWLEHEDLRPDDSELVFCWTADEIEDAYSHRRTGSCMEGTDWDSPYHPVRVYAHSDLAVIRLEDYSARVLAWPEKKFFGRIYGDDGEASDRLEEILEGLGYRNELPIGARITRDTHQGRYILPYIDGNYSTQHRHDNDLINLSCDDRGDHLVICDDGCGEIEAGSTNGLTGQLDGWQMCSSCAELSEGPLTSVNLAPGYGQREYCSSCADADTYVCSISLERYNQHNYSQVTLADGTTAWRENARYDGVTDDWYAPDHLDRLIEERAAAAARTRPTPRPRRTAAQAAA